MKTKIIIANKESVLRAAKLIMQNELVAFSTETVYGLGANALNKKAVEKIFIAKGRPQDNPLIVHIANKKQLNELVLNVPKKANILINKFWPGPLTIVLKKSKKVPKIITAGLDSVAIRMPRNKTALELIKNSCPIAAPSANTSGKPSPTNAEHVYDDLKNKIPLILDGGKCKIGIESTVIDFTRKIPTILRPGKITKKMIEKLIGKINIANEKTKVKSPGMKYRHYSPKAKVILIDDLKRLKINENEKIIIITKTKNHYKNKIEYKTNKELAQNIFYWFREADKKRFLKYM